MIEGEMIDVLVPAERLEVFRFRKEESRGEDSCREQAKFDETRWRFDCLQNDERTSTSVRIRDHHRAWGAALDETISSSIRKTSEERDAVDSRQVGEWEITEACRGQGIRGGLMNS